MRSGAFLGLLSKCLKVEFILASTVHWNNIWKGVARQELLDLLREEGPFDMVLADFATMSAIQVAEELGIPCIINVPGADLPK